MEGNQPTIVLAKEGREMSLRVKDIKLVHRKVGTKHVITSPDVPELHISHADKSIAMANVQPALDALATVRERIRARKAVREQKRERAAA